jgi:glycerol 3-phosphatase-2
MSQLDHLLSSAQPLIETYDALLVDLDGVVQLGDEVIPAAADALAAARTAGLGVAFITNNAARGQHDVVERLGRLGVPAEPDQVITSALAASQFLAGELPAGAPVLVVGGTGLWTAVLEVGLTPVRSAADAPLAVVQGWGPEVCWADLAEATVALRAGARWVVTNRDRTLPSPRGPLPGSGSLVAAVVTATDRDPDVVVGKPGRAMFDVAARVAGGAAPLVVGDRLDTDIAGGIGAGLPALLVLTGVSRPADVLSAPSGWRPSYLGLDIGAVTQPHPAVELTGEGATCRGTTVRTDATVERASVVTAGIDGLRAAAELAWAGRLPPETFDKVLTSLDLE